ncbi:hypothetical protein [Knoellia subterranea]|uniref:Haloacid dehalogenase n=1 Tax=Knoellia subterranea KCTC 19937 TaxID=1385521 RepID=A0A0A0JI29_9MICO|nr:hypothetical protein [Knoellia subterranea]KGN37010.1 hypothetical protein N803_16470 [Knoellia subterranea KCTC 19937]
MIKVLLLDLDGVLRIWDDALTAAVESDHGLPAGTLHRVACTPERLLPAITGVIDDGTWQAMITDLLVAEHGDRARDAVHDWLGPAGTVDTDVLTVVRHARTRLRVALLVNATSRLEDDLARLDLTGEVDSVTSSAHLGMALPEPDVYSTVAMRHGLMFSEIAYVDQSTVNVATAEILGIRSHHYTDVDGLRTFVDSVMA